MPDTLRQQLQQSLSPDSLQFADSLLQQSREAPAWLALLLVAAGTLVLLALFSLRT